MPCLCFAKMKSQTLFRVAVATLFLGLVLGVALVSFGLIIPPQIRAALNNSYQVPLDPSSESYEDWVTPSRGATEKFTFFHVTNPAAVMAGTSDPIVETVPVSWERATNIFDTQYSDDETSVTYKNFNTVEFNESPEWDQTITIADPIYQIVQTLLGLGETANADVRDASILGMMSIISYSALTATPLMTAYPTSLFGFLGMKYMIVDNVDSASDGTARTFHDLVDNVFAGTAGDDLTGWTYLDSSIPTERGALTGTCVADSLKASPTILNSSYLALNSEFEDSTATATAPVTVTSFGTDCTTSDIASLTAFIDEVAAANGAALYLSKVVGHSDLSTIFAAAGLSTMDADNAASHLLAATAVLWSGEVASAADFQAGNRFSSANLAFMDTNTLTALGMSVANSWTSQEAVSWHLTMGPGLLTALFGTDATALAAASAKVGGIIPLMSSGANSDALSGSDTETVISGVGAGFSTTTDPFDGSVTAKWTGYVGYSKFLAAQVYDGGSTPFITCTPREFLSTGVSRALAGSLNPAFASAALVPHFETREAAEAALIDTATTTTILTGKDDLTDSRMVTEFSSKESFTFSSGFVAEVKGYDIGMIPPNNWLTRDTELSMYVTLMYSNVELAYVEDSDVLGIETLRFTIDPFEKNAEQGDADGGVWDLRSADISGGSQVLLTPGHCGDLPVGRLGHCDVESGLDYDADTMYDSYLDFMPRTGLPINVHAVFNQNLQFTQATAPTFHAAFNGGTFPLMYLERDFMINEEERDLLNKLAAADTLAVVLLALGAVLGIGLIGTGAFLAVYSKKIAASTVVKGFTSGAKSSGGPTKRASNRYLQDKELKETTNTPQP